MDETLKRRLVGAAVLALIAIVIVPMLLDGPDWQQANDEPEVTTSRNAEGERVVSVSLNGDVPTGSLVGRSASGAGISSSSPRVGRGGGTESSGGRVSTNTSNGNANIPSVRNGSGRGGAQSATANRGSTASSSRGAQSGNSEAATNRNDRRAAAPLTRAGNGASAAERSGWVVQLATFGSEENAKRLVNKLNAGGWSAWLEPMTSRSGKRLQQVRVGPERSQAKAESLAERLGSQFKLKPQVLDLR